MCICEEGWVKDRLDYKGEHRADLTHLGRVRAADVVPDLGRLRDERVEEALHLRPLAERLLVVHRLRGQGCKGREQSNLRSKLNCKANFAVCQNGPFCPIIPHLGIYFGLRHEGRKVVC